MNMRQALEQSCNTYFIQLANQIGAEKVYEMAVLLGFGKETVLASGLVSKAGKLPDLSNLKSSSAALANFSIGQGDFLATPLQIAAMTAAVANGGAAPRPALTLGIRDADGSVRFDEPSTAVRAMSRSTAEQLAKMMVAVVASGTGNAAAPETGGAGGKTATAETGWKAEDGSAVLQAWFTGFYPAENPQYIITVLAEDGKSGSTTAAPVFKHIADGIAALSH